MTARDPAPPAPRTPDAAPPAARGGPPGAEPRRVDANALAGPLAEIFAVDVTPAQRRCSGCGHSGAFAELHVYADCPGLVARCPGCAAVVLRVVRNGATVWLDLGGTGCLRLTVE